MYLIYFDENKFDENSPRFVLGGILIPDEKAVELESTLNQIIYNFFGTTVLSKNTEMHGKEMFHNKGPFKKKKLAKRVQLFKDLGKFIVSNKLPVRLIGINVKAHREQYAYPEPEYQLALMLFLERCCDFLDKGDEIGVVFGDYEEDEMKRSLRDFSQFKFKGRTPMYFGRPLGRLIDTIYFTHSHHSRFLQLADVVVFMANRYEFNKSEKTKWHDKQVEQVWGTIKTETDFRIQTWL